MIKNLKVAFILMITFTGVAQENTYHEDVLTYFKINGTSEQYKNATNGLFDLLKKQYSTKNVPDAVWTSLEADAPKQVDRVLNMLVSAYRGSYNQEDIDNMISFYQSETGRQLLVDKTSLNYEQQKQASIFYNTQTGQKILMSEQEIAKNISEISEIWSRDLYRKMTDALAEKGYSM